MTKLTEYAEYFLVFMSIWYCLVTNKLGSSLVAQYHSAILYLPLALVLLLGVYAIGTVLYRTFTFNDCPDAAIELQKEILEAKEDLAKRGFKFESI